MVMSSDKHCTDFIGNAARKEDVDLVTLVIPLPCLLAGQLITRANAASSLILPSSW